MPKSLCASLKSGRHSPDGGIYRILNNKSLQNIGCIFTVICFIEKWHLYKLKNTKIRSYMNSSYKGNTIKKIQRYLYLEF